MEYVALFINNYSIGNSPSIINIIRFLSEKFYLDIYLKNVSLIDNPVLKIKNIRLFDIKNWQPFYWEIRSRFHQHTYLHFFCIDPAGFILCKHLYPNSKPIYYSLELYLKNDHFGLDYPPKIMHAEREHISEIKGLIIQSKEKEQYFREDYNLSEMIPAFLLPVSYEGESIREKSDYLRNTFDIEDDKRIAVHVGGIAEWFSLIELSRAFSTMDNWILFIQGYPSKTYLNKLRDTINDERIQNVIISERVYPTIEELYPIMQSCDLGIAWYNDISAGFRTAGKSSSKIPLYFRFGLPVLAKKYPSTIESIERTGCGVCIDNFSQIPSAVDTIAEKYQIYSDSAYHEYETTYKFENYKSELLNFITHTS